MDWEAVAAAIAEATGERASGGKGWPIGGGSINSAFRFEAGERALRIALSHTIAEFVFAPELVAFQTRQGARPFPIETIVGNSRTVRQAAKQNSLSYPGALRQQSATV